MVIQAAVPVIDSDDEEASLPAFWCRTSHLPAGRALVCRGNLNWSRPVRWLPISMSDTASSHPVALVRMPLAPSSWRWRLAGHPWCRAVRHRFELFGGGGEEPVTLQAELRPSAAPVQPVTAGRAGRRTPATAPDPNQRRNIAIGPRPGSQRRLQPSICRSSGPCMVAAPDMRNWSEDNGQHRPEPATPVLPATGVIRFAIFKASAR